jgi:hypothetical protein
MSEEPERSPADLLVEALDQLPPEDRKRVLAWLLQGGGHHWPRAVVGLVSTPGHLSPLPELSTMESEALISRFASLRGEHQTVPVRLPSDQYRRLRDWCQEQGFSMATVIRGLVARFLDERGKPAEAS